MKRDHDDKILPGERVGYSVQFLHAIHAAPLDPLCGYRGIVQKVDRLGTEVSLATVQWDNGKVDRVNVFNLAIVGPNPYFCNTGLGIDPLYYEWKKPKPAPKPILPSLFKKRNPFI